MKDYSKQGRLHKKIWEDPKPAWKPVKPGMIWKEDKVLILLPTQSDPSELSFEVHIWCMGKVNYVISTWLSEEKALPYQHVRRILHDPYST